MQRSMRVLCAAFVFLAILRPAVGEVFLLRSGGRIEGVLVNPDEKPRTSYVISLANGGQVTLDAAVVEKVQPVKPELVEYEKVRRQHPDTVQGHLQMSDWCRDHNLTAQRKTHMERVLQLDPDQPDARRFLGYRKFKDQWMTLEEEMAEKGYVKRGSTWMTQQDADLYDSRNKQRMAEIEWVKKISRWRAWLDGRQADQGTKNLRSINDPMAIFGLTERLVKKPDARGDARLLYVEVLGHINIPQAHGPLAMCAIDDPLEEVRLSSLDELEKQKDDASRATSSADARQAHEQRRHQPRRRGPGTRQGPKLHRHADPVSRDHPRRGDSARQRPRPDYHGVQQERRRRQRHGHEPEAQIVKHEMHNQGVLDGLIAITGQNFGYDQQQWAPGTTSRKAKGLPVVAEAKKN